VALGADRDPQPHAGIATLHRHLTAKSNASIGYVALALKYGEKPRDLQSAIEFFSGTMSSRSEQD
jgi:hypothetical protein